MNDNDRVEVSIVLPCYNGEDTLMKCLESINNQCYKIELVFVNDGSTDNSLKIFNKFKFDKNISIKLIDRENKGFLYSLNEAIGKSTGNFIARIDADDFWDENHIITILKKFNQNSDYVLIGSQCIIINDNDEVLGESNLPINHKKIVKWLHKDNPFIHSSVVFKKEVYLKTTGYYSSDSDFFKHIADYNLWFEFSKFGLCENINEKTVYYRFAENSMSRSINMVNNLKSRLYVMRNVNAYYKSYKTYYYYHKLKVSLKALIYKLF